jgi:hypothetical protein
MLDYKESDLYFFLLSFLQLSAEYGVKLRSIIIWQALACDLMRCLALCFLRDVAAVSVRPFCF